MYAIVEDNNITQYVNNPKSVVIGDVRYPAKIFEIWSQSEKEAIGIYEIVSDKTNYKDPEYYMNTASSCVFADGRSSADINVPSNVSTFRTNVRTKSNEMETQINNCANVDQLKALYTYTEQEDGTVTRPLAEFPEGI